MEKGFLINHELNKTIDLYERTFDNLPNLNKDVQDLTFTDLTRIEKLIKDLEKREK
jgi:hypothetical protein